MKKVEFVGVGMMRCGTTSAEKLMRENPQLAFPEHTKETQYWNTGKDHSVEGYEMFWESDKLHNSDLVCGEITPSYCAYPEAMRLIHEYNPDMKILFFLQDQVARAISHYQHSYPFHKGKIGFYDWLVERKNADPINTCLPGGDVSRYPYRQSQYSLRIEEAIELFGAENVHVVRMKDMIEDTQETFNKVCEFLGVDSVPVEFPHVNHDRNLDAITISEEEIEKVTNEIQSFHW